MTIDELIVILEQKYNGNEEVELVHTDERGNRWTTPLTTVESKGDDTVELV